MSLNKLEKLNSHKRDLRIKFDSENHIYTIDGNDNYISATELVNKFFPVFEKDFWANKQSEKTGIPKQEIIKEWDEIVEVRNATNSRKTADWAVSEYFYNKSGLFCLYESVVQHTGTTGLNSTKNRYDIGLNFNFNQYETDVLEVLRTIYL